MEYYKKIRQSIGHDPLMLVGCGCLIFNEKNQVLLQRRSDDGLWGNPGGIMDLGETIEETIIREIREETSLKVEEKDLELFKIYSGENQHHFYPNGDEVYFVNIIFEIHRYQGTVQKDFESLELKFFDIDEMPNELMNNFKQVAEDLKIRYSK